MAGYIVVDVNITDMEGFMEYASRIPELIEKYGGRYIVKGAVPEVIQGTKGKPQYLVVIEFPSVEVADEFVNERAESELVDIWNRSTDGRILRVEGCV